MSWKWKIFKITSLTVLGLGTITTIIVGFVIANKVDEKNAPPINEKSLEYEGFGHDLDDISVEQIKVLANTNSSLFTKPSDITVLTKEKVSKWKINIPGVTFALKDKVDGSSSWTFNDEEGSLSYDIVASKGSKNRIFNVVFAPGSFLSTNMIKIRNWIQLSSDGRKARYPSQRINLQKILFDNDDSRLFQNLKPIEIQKPNKTTINSNFKKLNFVSNLNKELVELEITKWDISVWTLRKRGQEPKPYGKLTIEIKFTYNSNNIVYTIFELPFLKTPNSS